MTRYYAIRPIVPGSVPRTQEIKGIMHFDRPLAVFGNGIPDCYGYVEYEEPLTDDEWMEYELFQAGLSQWWNVTEYLFEDGNRFAKVVKEQNKWSVGMPKNEVKFYKNGVLRRLWFEAENYAVEYAAEKFGRDTVKGMLNNCKDLYKEEITI